MKKVTQQAEAINSDALNGLNITWETDPAKMELQNLTDFPEWYPATFKIEYHPTEELNRFMPDHFSLMDEKMISLIDFVKCGEKLIPPAFVNMPRVLLERSILEGKTIESYSKECLDINDGRHRLSLAVAMGITEIPVIVCDLGETTMPEQSIKNNLFRLALINGVELSIQDGDGNPSTPVDGCIFHATCHGESNQGHADTTFSPGGICKSALVLSETNISCPIRWKVLKQNISKLRSDYGNDTNV